MFRTQMVGIRRVGISFMVSSGLLGKGIREGVSFRKKLLTRPSSIGTAGSLSCQCQLWPLPTYERSPNAETSIRHESLLECSLLHQGATSEELLGKVKRLLRKPSSQRSKLTLIDAIQRLGVGHHFGDEIRLLLEEFSDSGCGNHLFNTALRFRLMRHNGLQTSSDAFDEFIDANGEFKESLRQDTWGMLSLYEASNLGARGEEKLLKAMEFTKSHLVQSMPCMPADLRAKVAKALELPRHLRMATLEARNYIDEYSQESGHSTALLELAKSEFNELQALYRSDLAEIVRWWKQLGLVDKLDFARDRPFECFLWTVGIFPEARHSGIRIEIAKTVSILLVIDDIYDTYGSLDELVLFNDAIKRWELSAIDQLPEYMKICYMALYNTTNEIAYRVLVEHGLCVATHLKRTWLDIFDAFLAEAEWFNNKYTPSLDQYLTNGVTSGGSYMALVHSFFLLGQGVTDETVSMMQPYPELFSCSGKILRLWDDLGTAKEEQERGDVASSIECYMRENDIPSEDEARDHIKKLIKTLWLDLNAQLKAQNTLPESITKACFNLARTAQVIYQHGDDESLFSVEDHVKSLFFRPCK